MWPGGPVYSPGYYEAAAGPPWQPWSGLHTPGTGDLYTGTMQPQDTNLHKV